MMNYCNDLIKRLFGDHIGAKILTFLLAYIASIPFLSIFIIMIVLDWVTGLWKAIAKRDIHSEKLKQGIAKVTLYMICIIAAKELSKIHSLITFIESLMVSMIIITEFISIIENVIVILACNNIELPFLSQIIKYLKKFQGETMETICNVEEEK